MKKIKLLSGVLVGALLCMGVGYAAWTQSFTVTNAVNTGELKVGIERATKPELDAIDSKGHEVRNISAASAKWALHKEGDEKINLEIGNAFPGLRASYWINVKNYGTVPVRAEKIVVKGMTPLAQALIDNGYVSFLPGTADKDYQFPCTIKPGDYLKWRGYDGFIVDVWTYWMPMKVTFNSNMPEEIKVGNDLVKIENQNLVFETYYPVVQDTK
jgi:hypothetical protein